MIGLGYVDKDFEITFLLLNSVHAVNTSHVI